MEDHRETCESVSIPYVRLVEGGVSVTCCGVCILFEVLREAPAVCIITLPASYFLGGTDTMRSLTVSTGTCFEFVYGESVCCVRIGRRFEVSDAEDAR
jgi:hypothetical protein